MIISALQMRFLVFLAVLLLSLLNDGNQLATALVVSSTKCSTSSIKNSDDAANTNRNALSRRCWIRSSVNAAAVAAATILLSIVSADAADAADAAEGATATTTATTDVEEALIQARSTLQTLLDNWSSAVIDCTYADVPRDLLKAENKELLLEKAKVSALFDKSASVVSCKTINTKVRDYIGVTSKGPVSVLPKVLKAGVTQMVENDDSSTDDIDLYVQTTEQVQQALFKADSLSYEARRDFTSMNNFDESQQDKVLSDANSNLFQAKQAIVAATEGLDVLLKLLRTESS